MEISAAAGSHWYNVWPEKSNNALPHSRFDQPNLPQHATNQSGDMTRTEINEGPARFWAEKDFPPHSLAASNAAMTAVELAAREGSIDALHAVLARDPDISFWLLAQVS